MISDHHCTAIYAFFNYSYLVIFPSAPYNWFNWRILRDEDEYSEVVENRLKKCNTLRYYLDKLNMRVRSDPHGAENPELVYETIGEQQASSSSFIGTVYVALVHKSALPEEPNPNPEPSNFASMLLNRRMDRASRANSRMYSTCIFNIQIRFECHCAMFSLNRIVYRPHLLVCRSGHERSKHSRVAG